MLDAYLWGKVDRISPEAPVPIVSVTKKEQRLGGASNVALNIQALGGTPFICSIVGDDIEGMQFIELLKQNNISETGITIVKDRRTTVKTRVIGNNQQILRVDAETDKIITAEHSNQVFDKINGILNISEIHVIIFEDYDKGLISEELVEKVVQLAKQKKILTVVDPKKVNFLSYRNVDVFKPNLKELKEGLKTEFDVNDINELKKAVTNLKQKIQAKAVVVTLSELGIFVLDGEKSAITPAHIRNVADVSGAGDTVISVLAMCLASGVSVFKSAEIGNLAGGLVCEKVGVIPVDKKQLLTEALKL